MRDRILDIKVKTSMKRDQRLLTKDQRSEMRIETLKIRTKRSNMTDRRQ